jgi:hypothetical protein
VSRRCGTKRDVAGIDRDRHAPLGGTDHDVAAPELEARQGSDVRRDHDLDLG